MRSAAAAAGATILSIYLHGFEPSGVTGVALLAELHMSIHTWPEDGYAAIDIFMCGACDPGLALAELTRMLEPKRQSVTMIERGANEGLATPLSPIVKISKAS